MPRVPLFHPLRYAYDPATSKLRASLFGTTVFESSTGLNGLEISTVANVPSQFTAMYALFPETRIYRGPEPITSDVFSTGALGSETSTTYIFPFGAPKSTAYK